MAQDRAGGGKAGRVVEAAAGLFLRHGYGRTTMGHIAEAAGMSRPALYLLFPGKTEVFEAAVRYISETRYAEFWATLHASATLRQRLQRVCDMVLVGVFELLRENPDAGDMDDLSFPVVRETYGVLEDKIAGLIDEAGLADLPAPPAALARGLLFGVRGLGEAALDADDMRAMTRLQVDLLCRAIGAD